MVSRGLAIAAETEVDKDTLEDSGVRIRRPSAFLGITKKYAKKGSIPERDFKTTEGTIDEHWIIPNQEADTYLCHQEDRRGK
eukprot:1936787-Heterocapsa_arctica.AAC.1